MQVKILHAVNLRFPGEGKSAQGQSGAKARPIGVVDAHQANIPEPMRRSNRSALRKEPRKATRAKHCPY